MLSIPNIFIDHLCSFDIAIFPYGTHAVPII